MAIDVKIDDIKNGWLVSSDYLAEITYVKTLVAAVTLAKKIITEAAAKRAEVNGS